MVRHLGCYAAGRVFNSLFPWVVLVSLAVAPVRPAHAAPGDIVDWYGVVRFSKKLESHVTGSIPDGTESYDKTVTWSGTARFLPGRKLVMTASYHRKEVRSRRQDRMATCPRKDSKTAYHDYELLESNSKVSVNQEWDNQRLRFSVSERGAYEGRFTASGGNHVDGAWKMHSRREFYDECSRPHLWVNDQEVAVSDGMEAIGIEHISGIAKPNAETLSGSWSGKDDDGGDMTYTWELKRAEPLLVARAQANPSPVLRAEMVTLSAAGSKGPITRYEWEFIPTDEDCAFTPEGAEVRLTGVSVSFRALKGFPQAIEAIFSKTQVQLCIVHQIRGSLRYLASKYHREFVADLKQVYRSDNAETAEGALTALEHKWGVKCPHAVSGWRTNWTNLSTYFQFPAEVRKMIYTTNAVEAVYRQFRKVTKTKGLVPDRRRARKDAPSRNP